MDGAWHHQISTRNSSDTLDTSSTLVWDLLFLFTVLSGAGHFVVIKDAIGYISAARLMTLRFVFAVVLLPSSLEKT